MAYKDLTIYDGNLYENLKIDCEKCFGFCCAALYFSASDGFPADKVAGKPCMNLQDDFKCKVHQNLRQKGLKGCTAYDCFGAGQKVAQTTYKGHDWRKNPQNKNQMFDVFLIMRQLHEILWYLAEAFRIQNDDTIKKDIGNMINETLKLTDLDIDSIMKLDLITHRSKVNALLIKTNELIRNKVRKGQKESLKHKKMVAGRPNYIGSDLRKTNLIGEDLRGALLIAANLNGADLSGTNLIGADLRDADIRGANLRNSIFVTQFQINEAKGDSNTKLPITIVRPEYWDK